MNATRPPRPVCEVDRAYLDLIPRPRSETVGAASLCSPEVPELREYPAAPAGARNYVLCNGHLTDLLDEQARTRQSTVTV